MFPENWVNWVLSVAIIIGAKVAPLGSLDCQPQLTRDNQNTKEIAHLYNMPPFCRPHLIKYPGLSILTRKDFCWQNFYMQREFIILPQTLYCLYWVPISNSEYVIWLIREGKMLRLPLASLLRHAI